MATNLLDVIRVAVKWRNQYSGDVVNVFDFQLAGSVFPLTDGEVIDDVRNMIDTIYGDSDMIQSMHAANKHEEIAIFSVSNDYPIGYTGRVSTLDGVDAADTLPTGVAQLVIFRTAVSRRVGKKYLPPYSVGAMTADEFDVSYNIRAQNWAEQLMVPFTALSGALYRYVVLSSVTLTPTIPTSYAVRSIPAYQRRRREGRGA